MPLDYPQRRQNLVCGGKSGFIGYLMIRPPGPWQMYWKTLKGLVLWMDFNQCQAIDLSGHGNNGTIYGAQCVQGRSGKALSFDGVDDYVEVPDSASLTVTDAVTILAWINWAGLKYCTLLQKKTIGETDEDQEYALYPKFWASAPNDRYVAHINGTTISSGYYLEDLINFKEWVQIGIIYAGDAIAGSGNAYVKFILNGEIIAIKSAPASITNSNGVLLIGEHTSQGAVSAGEGDNHFNGIIDEVRIYNRALSEEEIKWLYEHT